ncbi:alpha/beta hydrolase family protein [Anaeromyxobacter sp. Red801]|uniref:alpha/beta hydrolase family protein n=1 Tax=Anaeromyxobacter sp. Red801 TaxID=3411632 RepID=UPI003BA22D41
MHVLDVLFGLTAAGPRFFADGWGDRRLVKRLQPLPLARRAPARVDVSLGPPRAAHGGTLRDGSFRSPESRLPGCARAARVQVLLPEGPLRGVAVHLAASGDQGFAMRLRFAAPLLAHGLGAIVLENAFYGARRPERQARHAVRSVSDLYLMGAATFQEGRALLAWAREALGAPRVGVTGYSMGGQLAAMVGASMPWPVATVPLAPSCSPDSVLLSGVLRDVPDWAALAGDAADREAARVELCAGLSRFSVCALPPPVAPGAAIVVGTAADGVVPPAEMARIAAHWSCELRWLPAGHVSAVLRHQGAMREAILDAFLRLEAAEREVSPAAPGSAGSGRRASSRARSRRAGPRGRAPGRLR